MTHNRHAAIGFVAFVLLGLHYYYGFPLRDVLRNTPCVNATLETAAATDYQVFFPVERELTGVPYINCRAAVVIDNSTSTILIEKRSTEERSIASLTKLMTALVVIDLDFDWSGVVSVTRDDAHNSARSRLKIGEKFYASDLFYIMLINSDNRAARAVARSTGLSREEFVATMNAKARNLGMFHTVFTEPTGLDPGNRSTAIDCARLLNAAVEHELISSAMRTRHFAYRSLNHKRRRRIVNTNRLLASRYEIMGGKTGYIQESGYCFATRLRDDSNRDLTIIVLGAPGPQRRFNVANDIASCALRNLKKWEEEKRHVSSEEVEGSSD